MQGTLSTNERQFITSALADGGQRVDGRSAFQCRRTRFTFDRSDNECQVEVQFGRTRVLAVVSATVAQPYDDRPTEGFVSVFAALSPMADPAFGADSGSKFSAPTLEIRSVLEGLLKDGNAMDFEALCIVAGEKVWSIRIDVCILDNAGNLVDASAVAMMAALLYFRKSAVEVAEGTNEVRLLPSHESEPTPLSIHHVPLSSTLLVYNNGDSAILDPTEREELALECRVTYSFNIHRELCMLQKLGGEAMSQAAVMKFARLAFSDVEKRIHELKAAVEEAVKAADERRWKVRTQTMGDVRADSIFLRSHAGLEQRAGGAAAVAPVPFEQPKPDDELLRLLAEEKRKVEEGAGAGGGGGGGGGGGSAEAAAAPRGGGGDGGDGQSPNRKKATKGKKKKKKQGNKQHPPR